MKQKTAYPLPPSLYSTLYQTIARAGTDKGEGASEADTADGKHSRPCRSDAFARSRTQ